MAYDIADTKRRTKARETLANFGARVQYSFFERDMEKKRMEELKARLKWLTEYESAFTDEKFRIS